MGRSRWMTMLAAALVTWALPLPAVQAGAAAPSPLAGLTPDAGPPAVPAPPAADGGLGELLALALAGHPALDAGRERWSAWRRQRDAATALPDPVLGVGWQLASVETRVGPQRVKWSLTQRFPWFGTLGLRGRTVDARADAAAARWRGRLLAVLRDGQRQWYELAWLGRAIAVTREHLDLVSGWERVASRRYAAGEGSYADLMRIQIEMGSLEDKLRSLNERVAAVRADLAAALGLPPDTPLPVPAALPVPRPLPPDSVLAGWVADHPDLAVLDAEARRFALERDLAGKKGLPSFSLGLDVIATDPAAVDLPDSGKDPVVARLGLTLPLWRGAYRAEGEAAQARERAVRADRRDRRRRLRARLANALFTFHDAVSRQRLHDETLLPRARQALDAVSSLYATGEAGYLDLIDAERTLLRLSLDRDRAVADQGRAEAEIVAVTGGAWAPTALLPLLNDEVSR